MQSLINTIILSSLIDFKCDTNKGAGIKDKVPGTTHSVLSPSPRRGTLYSTELYGYWRILRENWGEAEKGVAGLHTEYYYTEYDRE